MQSLSTSLVAVYGDFLAALDDEEKLSVLTHRFEKLGQIVHQRQRHQQLDSQTAQRAWTVAHNILRAGEALQQLAGDTDTAIVQLNDELNSLKLTTTFRSKRESSSLPPSSKRVKSTYITAQTSHLSTDNSSTSPSDAIRLWFLHHLADPYPTPLQKRNLSSSTSIPVPRLEAHLTNWRRRAGWSAILHKRCGGEKYLMAVLVKRVLAGEEKDQEVIKEVEGVQKYLRKEEEGRVGEWVYQLAELAKKAQAPSADTIETTNDEQDADDASPPLAASSDASPSSTTTSDRSDLLLQTHHSSNSSSPSSSLDSSSPPAPARQIIHPPPADAAFNHRILSAASSFSSLSASSATVRATPRSTSTNSNTSSTFTTSGISSVAAASVALGSAIDTASMGTALRRRTSSVRSTAEGEIEYLAEAPTDGNFSFTPFSFFPSPASTTSAAHTYAISNGYAALPGYQPVYYVPNIRALADPNDELHHGIKRPADAESPATGPKVKDAKYQQYTPSGDEHAPWVFNHPLGPPTGFSLGTCSPSASTPSKRATRPGSHPVNHFAQDGASTFATQEYSLACPAGMWSTTNELPLLPHMVAMDPVAGNFDNGADAVRESKGWALPSQHAFEPSFPDWA